MKTKLALVAASVGGFLLAAMLVVPGVLAQAPNPTPPGTQNQNGNATAPRQGMMQGGNGMMGGGHGMGMQMGRAGASLLAVAADEIGITQEQLIEELGGTKSIAQVATEHNVQPSVIVESFLDPREQRLADLVAAGKITQAQADEMLATMTTNVNEHINQVWTPRGPGQGAGFVDENGDGVCDNMPANGGMMRGKRGGPNR